MSPTFVGTVRASLGDDAAPAQRIGRDRKARRLPKKLPKTVPPVIAEDVFAGLVVQEALAVFGQSSELNWLQAKRWIEARVRKGISVPEEDVERLRQLARQYKAELSQTGISIPD